MHKIRIISSGIALVFGFVVLGVSLISVSQAQSANNDKQFYVAKQILPDHVAYPMLMAMDRVKLESASPLERLYLKTTYANRRLLYSQQLLEKENKDLAFDTLTKSQRYVQDAALTALDQSMPLAVKQHTLKTIQFHTSRVIALKDQFGNQHGTGVDKLVSENQMLIDRLTQTLAEADNDVVYILPE